MSIVKPEDDRDKSETYTRPISATGARSIEKIVESVTSVDDYHSEEKLQKICAV